MITHDSHVNSDGEALYRFLLEQNKLPPVLHAQITGSHVVRSTVWERDDRGRSRSRTEQRTVTDFRFRIDLTGGLQAVFAAGEDFQTLEATIGGEWGGHREIQKDVKGVLKVCGDEEKVYRGGRWKQKYSPPRLRTLPGDMQGLLSPSSEQVGCDRDHDLESRGSPHYNPALSSAVSRIEIPALTPDSALSIRAWADRYCHLPTPLKEFIVRKTVTNLDRPLLTRLLTNAVRSTGYRGNVAIHYPKSHHKIAIYPDTRFARLRNNPWVRWFFYLTFLWIFTWPLLYFSTKKFHIIVSEWAWGFVVVPRLEDGGGGEGEGTAAGQGENEGDEDNPRLSSAGDSERAWAELWAGAIRLAARNRRQNDQILSHRDIWDAAQLEERRRLASMCSRPSGPRGLNIVTALLGALVGRRWSGRSTGGPAGVASDRYSGSRNGSGSGNWSGSGSGSESVRKLGSGRWRWSSSGYTRDDYNEWGEGTWGEDENW